MPKYRYVSLMLFWRMILFSNQTYSLKGKSPKHTQDVTYKIAYKPFVILGNYNDFFIFSFSSEASVIFYNFQKCNMVSLKHSLDSWRIHCTQKYNFCIKTQVKLEAFSAIGISVFGELSSGVCQK